MIWIGKCPDIYVRSTGKEQELHVVSAKSASRDTIWTTMAPGADMEYNGKQEAFY